MSPETEASIRMTQAWSQMGKGPGRKFYLTMDGQKVRQIQDALKEPKLPNDIADIPGILDIVSYLNALNDYLEAPTI